MKTIIEKFIKDERYKVAQEYDKDTGKKVKKTVYRFDGKTIWFVNEYDKKTSKHVLIN